MPFGQFFQKKLMHRRMHARENQRIHHPVERTQGRESVRVFPDGLLGDIRPHMPGRPTICRAGDPSEPRFIFKQNAEREFFEIRFQLRPLEDQGEKTP